MYLPSYNISSLSQLRITYVHNSMPNWCPQKKYRFQIPWCKCNYKSRWKKTAILHLTLCGVHFHVFSNAFPNTDSRIHPKFYCPTISPTAFPTKNLNLILQAARCARRCEPPRATRAAAASHWPPMTACIKGVEPLAWKAILVAKWLCLRIVYCIYCISLQMAIFWWG